MSQHTRRSQQKLLHLLWFLAIIVLIDLIVGSFSVTQETKNEQVFTTKVEQEQLKGKWMLYSIDKIEITTAVETVTETVTEAKTETTTATTTTTTTVTVVDSENETESESVLKEYVNVNEDLLAKAIYCEAGGTGDLNEMMYVGKVMLNRITSNAHDFRNVNTLSEVLEQRGQYPETLEKIRRGVEPCKMAKEAAHKLLCGQALSYKDKNGNWQEFDENILWQTGFVPNWDATVEFSTEYHYYSKES